MRCAIYGRVSTKDKGQEVEINCGNCVNSAALRVGRSCESTSTTRPVRRATATSLRRCSRTPASAGLIASCSGRLTG